MKKGGNRRKTRCDVCGVPRVGWIQSSSRHQLLDLSRDRRTCLLIYLTLPGPLHHNASHPVPLGRHRRPSWARRRLQRSSSSPDPEPSLRHPSWVGRIPGCCFRHNPSQAPPPLPAGHRHAALQLFVLATRGQAAEHCGRFGSKRRCRRGGRRVVGSWVCRV